MTEAPITSPARLAREFDRKRAQLTDKLAGSDIPTYMHDAVLDWILNGRIPGDFLHAVIRNNLSEAIAHADDNNSQALRAYVQFLYCSAPAASWGSPEALELWNAGNGYAGMLVREHEEEKARRAIAEGGDNGDDR